MAHIRPLLALLVLALIAFWPLVLHPTETLYSDSSDLLAEHLPAGQLIDFLSIDVEGLDLQVLRSNDWSRFRSRALLVEARGVELDSLGLDPACSFARSVGYRPVAKTVNTVIFTQDGSR